MSTQWSTGLVGGTNRNEALFRSLRSGKQIRAAGKARMRDYGRSRGRAAQKRPRVDDSLPATFGFQRMLDVLGRLLPGAKA